MISVLVITHCEFIQTLYDRYFVAEKCENNQINTQEHSPSVIGLPDLYIDIELSKLVCLHAQGLLTFANCEALAKRLRVCANTLISGPFH